MTELELRDPRKTYRSRGRPAVDAARGIDHALHSGELLGPLGLSGCGKSTTLRMIAGLRTVTGVDILVGGASVVDRPARRRNIGVAFENHALPLDEPLSPPDAAQRDTTRRQLKCTQRDLGHTTIRVTHDQEEALSPADRAAVMKDGRTHVFDAETGDSLR